VVTSLVEWLVLQHLCCRLIRRQCVTTLTVQCVCSPGKMLPMRSIDYRLRQLQSNAGLLINNSRVYRLEACLVGTVRVGSGKVSTGTGVLDFAREFLVVSE